jgi:HAMP domain
MAKTAVRQAKRGDAARQGNGRVERAATTTDGARPGGTDATLARLERALRAAAEGDFSVRLPARRKDEIGRLESAYNQLAARNAALAVRVGETSAGRDG